MINWFLGGMMSYSASVMPYISETVHPSIRGSLATLPAFMMSAGMVMVWIIAYFLTWRMTAYLLVIPPILLFLLMALLPETPYWLIENDDIGAKYLFFVSSRSLKTRELTLIKIFLTIPTKGWCDEFDSRLNIIIGIVQKVYEWPSCHFTKLIPLWVHHFGKRTAWSLIYFLNYAYYDI